MKVKVRIDTLRKRGESIRISLCRNSLFFFVSYNKSSITAQIFDAVAPAGHRIALFAWKSKNFM
jgi:hypothetical protein